MTDEQKILMARTIIGEDITIATDDILSVYLQLACYKMLERLYPYDTSKEASDLPTRYDTLQCELAARMYLRRGGEGETSHEENGVNRTYGTVDDEDILARLTPFVKLGYVPETEETSETTDTAEETGEGTGEGE